VRIGVPSLGLGNEQSAPLITVDERQGAGAQRMRFRDGKNAERVPAEQLRQVDLRRGGQLASADLGLDRQLVDHAGTDKPDSRPIRQELARGDRRVRHLTRRTTARCGHRAGPSRAGIGERIGRVSVRRLELLDGLVEVLVDDDAVVPRLPRLRLVYGCEHRDRLES
jgi:hypothetical protein